MRCPDCNKFVSYDEPEVEVNGVDIHDQTVSISTRVILKCADCGTELKDAEIEAEAEIEHECKTEDAKADEGWEEGDDQFEAVDDYPECEATNRVQDKDRHGKQIKSARYMKTFYGFSTEVECHCKKCGENFNVSLEGEEQASGFNECC